ncbi:hypothetical protein [Lactiplantibacillus plantarum]|uniref:hypothetical protein n=1 Tax=Lactiplantibacillus plantarum TaxID=1590 RepID=UPI0025B43A78|nr:hypothetical protein [Lactiplantibacillus plantarum]MDN3983928.1 hypothetical protein [Lactiplantibacillus plantarum]
MANRYDEIPNYYFTKLLMYHELTDRQIKYVGFEIEKAALENKRKVYIDLITFNPSQKRKLEQVLKSKDYQFAEGSDCSITINL